jgi:hypothetical protein
MDKLQELAALAAAQGGLSGAEEQLRIQLAELVREYSRDLVCFNPSTYVLHPSPSLSREYLAH